MKRFLAVLLCFLLVPSPAFAEDPPAKPAEPPKKGGDVVLSIDDEIGQSTVIAAVTAASEAKEKTADRMVIRLFTPGGGVFEGFKVIRIIKEAKRQVPDMKVVCEVEVAISMGFVILESGVCDERVVHPYSLLMTHGVRGGGSDNTEITVGSQLAALRAIEQALCEMMAPQLHMTADELHALTLRGELWLTGAEAMKLGWVDRME